MLDYIEIIFNIDKWVWLIIASAISLVIFLLPKKGNQRYGAARFATKRIAKKIGLFANDGLVVGKAFRRVLKIGTNLSVLIIAPPGTGKTAAIAVPTLLSCKKRSFLVNDVKGELSRITSKYRSKFSKVFKFAPGQKNSCCWNPLSATSLGSEPLVRVSQISSILYPDPRGSGDKHWSVEARNAFNFFAMAHIENKGETSLSEIRESALGDPKNRIRELLSGCSDKTRAKGEYIASKSPQEFSGVISTFQSVLQCFEDPLVEMATSKSDFDFQSFCDELTTLYLCILPQDIERLRVLLNLFFEMATLSLLSQSENKKGIGVTLMLDEFPRLGNLKQVVNAAALSRGLNFNSMIFAQDYDQLVEIYGPSIQGIMDGNSGYRCILPQNNADTAEKISRSIGTKTVERKSVSSNHEGLRSRSISHESMRLVTAQELLSMKPNKMLLVAQNHAQTPIKAQQIRWYKEKSFIKEAECIV